MLDIDRHVLTNVTQLRTLSFHQDALSRGLERSTGYGEIQAIQPTGPLLANTLPSNVLLSRMSSTIPSRTPRTFRSPESGSRECYLTICVYPLQSAFSAGNCLASPSQKTVINPRSAAFVLWGLELILNYYCFYVFAQCASRLLTRETASFGDLF